MSERLIFICYSPKDRTWKERLEEQLGVLEQQGSLEIFSNTNIGAGEDEIKKAEEALGKACVAVLLVSAGTLNAKNILRAEISKLLTLRAEGGLRIFPIIVSACLWEKVEWLARMGVRPRDKKPLQEKNAAQKARELTDIVSEIAIIIDSVAGSASQTVLPPEVPARVETPPPPPERAKVEPLQKPAPAATPRESDLLHGLEEKAATDPDLRRKLYDLASRLKTKGQPTSGSVTFYQEASDNPIEETPPKTSGRDFKAQVPGGQVNAK